MIPESPEGYRVAIVGASSLLGKELLAVLKERQFPASRIIELESNSGSELDLPIVDLDEAEPEASFNPEIQPGDIDVAFLAAPAEGLPEFLKPEFGQGARRPLVIDLEGNSGQAGEPRIALLESGSGTAHPESASDILAAAHPASIVVCLLLLRLASRIQLSTAVAHVFAPVSHFGPRAIEELQKQTVNLLSFQKAPRSIFGAQLAFNVLPQLTGSGSATEDALHARLGVEINRYLGGRVPTPAVRLLQTPVFYSMAISLYVETAVAINPARAAELLAGNGVRLRRASDPVSSQVEVTGSDEILVNSVVSDVNRPQGLWIWAVADNLRLAAQNAVQVAEQLVGEERKRPSPGDGKVVVH
jgi:aspartate-semialdehyde dehydrogenase